MSLLNGVPSSPDEASPPDLADGSWGIFYTPGMVFFGRARHPVSEDDSDSGRLFVLEPAYEYIAQTQVTPQGVNRPRYMVPLEMMVDARVLEVRPYAVTWLSDWSEDDRAEMLKGLAGALKLRDQIKRARSPIALAPAGSVPPFKGRA